MPIVLVAIIAAGALYWIVPDKQERLPIEKEVRDTAMVIVGLREPY